MNNTFREEIKIPLVVENELALSFEMTLSKETLYEKTIKDFKGMINEIKKKDKLELVNNSLRTFDCNVLNESKTIDYYGRTLPFYCQFKHIGREDENFISFADVSQEGMIKEFSDSAPKWRITYTGLNLYGICENEDCEAYNKEVICPMKLRTFDFAYDFEDVKCPLCKSYVDPYNCCFWNCLYKFEGIKNVKGRKPENVKYQDFKLAPKENFVKFNGEKDNLQEWKALKVFTKCVRNDEYSQAILKGNICRICDTPITEEEKILNCGHKFHNYCLVQIYKSEIDINKCLLCERQF